MEVEVLVVDGHSTDKTREIARNRGARILTQKGKGKGNGLRSAFVQFRGQYLYILDADETYPTDHLKTMHSLLAGGHCDVVMGSRLNGHIAPGAMTAMNYVGNRVLTGTANVLFNSGAHTSDICTGMWGFKRTVLKEIRLESKGFEIEAELYAKCIKNGFRIREIPIQYLKRLTPPKLRALKDGVRIFLRLILERIRH